ncbi:putative polysaccharide biosynthesis protein [Cantharellus anzutake]|uniref:putative polysaccharide biosynthesis protein n=1 Tax=Cantharellus anzutake TaxID=1750568 RepID=UPI001905FC1A|nr:putative polysaccharide biosynthesis protein [Cantharellus anzutake]KAF8337000.1 putative polysaccharide biosynthesis protein [Cantharellus anzutake]
MTTVPLDKFDPNKAENLDEIEKQFAVVAVQHAEIYWRILRKPPQSIRLTKIDDAIFEAFREGFPELFADTKQIEVVDEDSMKSPGNKTRWRKWIEQFKDKVQDYNFGTLLRRDARVEYTEDNTIFVVRMQFLAFEIARNRMTLNDEAHSKAKAEAS